MKLFNLLLRRILNQRTVDRFSDHRDDTMAIREDPEIVGEYPAAVEEGKGGAVGAFGEGVYLFGCCSLILLIVEVVLAK